MRKARFPFPNNFIHRLGCQTMASMVLCMETMWRAWRPAASSFPWRPCLAGSIQERHEYSRTYARRPVAAEVAKCSPVWPSGVVFSPKAGSSRVAKVAAPLNCTLFQRESHWTAVHVHWQRLTLFRLHQMRFQCSQGRSSQLMSPLAATRLSSSRDRHAWQLHLSSMLAVLQMLQNWGSW